MVVADASRFVMALSPAVTFCSERGTGVVGDGRKRRTPHGWRPYRRSWLNQTGRSHGPPADV